MAPRASTANTDAASSSSVATEARPKTSSSLVRSDTSASNIIMDEIWGECVNNVELQMVAKATIKEFKDNLSKAESAQMSMPELVRSTVESRKRKTDDDEDDEAEETMDEDSVGGTVRRGQVVFAAWVPKLMNEALQFIDKRVWDSHTLKALSIESKLEAFEGALDILCHGDRLDRVGTTDKWKLFLALKKCYKDLGSWWQHMVVDLCAGRILWKRCGPYIKEDMPNKIIKVTLTAWASNANDDRVVELSDHNSLGDEGPFDMYLPFSTRQVALVSRSTEETYTLASFFPGNRRRLGKTPSAERGSVTLCKKTARQHDVEKREQKKTKSKAPPIGIKSFAPSPSPATTSAPVVAPPPTMSSQAQASATPSQDQSLPVEAGAAASSTTAASVPAETPSNVDETPFYVYCEGCEEGRAS